MQLRLVMALGLRPKRADRSITGTTAPRRLITPRTHAGIIGTVARLPYSMISLMCRMPTANCSSPSMKVRNWLGSAAPLCSAAIAPTRQLTPYVIMLFAESGLADWLDVCIVSSFL